MSKSRTAREARDHKTPERSVAEGLEQKVLEFAEQLGWLVGTVNARSEGWLDRKALSAQVGRIRDGAAELMTRFESDESPAPAARSAKGSQAAAGRAAKRAKGANSSRASSSPAARKNATSAKKAAPAKDRGPVDAPGKRHRQAPPATHGIKHSDERVAKVILSRQMTRRPRG